MPTKVARPTGSDLVPTNPIQQQSPYPGGQRAAAAKPSVPDNPRLWDRETTCAFFGGIDPSTLYRGMYAGRYPRPVLVSEHIARWLAEECEAALDRMIAARDEPRTKPEHRGRPRVSRLERAASEAATAVKLAAKLEEAASKAKAKTVTETETT